MKEDYTKKPAGAYYTSRNNRQWYKQRNQEVYKDKMSGMTNLELVIKYQISQPRLQQIIANERRQHEQSRKGN